MMAQFNSRKAAAVTLTAAFTLTTGCSMFHENVKGGFLCQAPKGVCAPSSSIDDAALAQMGSPHADGALVPSSDMAMAGSMDGKAKRRTKSSKHSQSVDVQVAAAGDGRPALRIVHPAWRDAEGRLHARTTQYAYVDAVPAAYASPAVDYGDVPGDGNDHSLLGVAQRAPDIGSMATGQVPVASSSPATSAAPAPNPTDAIRARVSAILAEAPKPVVMTTPVAPVPVTPSNAAANNPSGSTFPPSGSSVFSATSVAAAPSAPSDATSTNQPGDPVPRPRS